MPLQNRVTPFGNIEANPARGMFAGNRGIIHDPATRTLTRRWSTKAWLVCVCWFQDRRREVMAGRSWTELFFLDEAVALAAGHRPCFYCRREDAERFRDAFAAGRNIAVPGAPEMDAMLHAERLDRSRKRIHPLHEPIESLAEGTFLAADGAALLVAGGGLRVWTHDGYQPAPPAATIDGMLTPPSTLAALRAGYRPILHPSARAPSH